MLWSVILSAELCSLSGPLKAAVSDGYIVKVDSAVVYLDWGKSSGAAIGDQFKVYRAGEPLKHPVTGEILGQTEVDLGQGVIQTLDDKFSIGKLAEAKGSIKPGDKTRHVETAPVSPTPAAVSVPAATPSAVSGPKLLWKSEAIAHQAMGIAIGDVDGDGKKEVVVAFRDHVEVFRWNAQKLESAAVFKARGYDNYLSVETIDIDGAGHDKIFVSLFLEGSKRAKTFVLEWSDGKLKEVGRLDGFVRVVDHADGKRMLLTQDVSLSRELRIRPPALMTKTDKGFREGDPLKMNYALNKAQLFGFTWGDWDGDGQDDFAILQDGERLRIKFSSAKGLKDSMWNGGDGFGGTKSDFSWENEQVGSLFPRLLPLKMGAEKNQLLVPHNISFMPFRLARIKIFKTSELFSLAWNGQEMVPAWTLPVTGALADFGLGDAQGVGSPQLWIASVSSNDATVLLAYQLP